MTATTGLGGARRASSEDGRLLAIVGRDPLPVRPGDLVTVVDGDVRVLGQVREHRPADRALVGVVLGAVDEAGVLRPGPVPPFEGLPVAAATAEDLGAVQGELSVPLEVGTWTSAGVTVDALIDGAAFNRHTFLCGQSGSGKTYALGVILERLLASTDLRVVVADPNSDYVHLGSAVSPAYREDVARMTRHGVEVLGSNLSGRRHLRMRYMAMPRAAQAAMLQLGPLADRDEYDLFLNATSINADQEVGEFVTGLRAGTPDQRRLGQRVGNLGLDRWEVWAGREDAVTEVVDRGPGLTVMDLAGFGDPLEPVAVCLALVEELWRRREERQPTLLVIDEAHNLCPPEPDGPIARALVARLVQIAAEGRKYGLWLLLSTQRPSKIHPQVLSQCDNLFLMRMNSTEDVADLVRAFGYAPAELVSAAQAFRQGEALAAGRLVPVPSVVRMGERWTRQGGVDIRVPVADPPTTG